MKEEQIMHYFTLAGTKALMNTFTSWIGKKAHIGQGVTETLKAIEIKEREGLPSGEKQFMVEFKFESRKTFPAAEFLMLNGFRDLNLEANIGGTEAA